MQNNRLPDYLEHIRQAAMNACDFVAGETKEKFLADLRTQQAVIMSILVVGEAATSVMENFPDFAEANPQIPWRAMRGMRNRMVHGYFDIDLEVVWETVQTALPKLLAELETLP